MMIGYIIIVQANLMGLLLTGAIVRGRKSMGSTILAPFTDCGLVDVKELGTVGT